MNYQQITKASIQRALTAAALRYDGLKFHEIGEQLGGVTAQTARQFVTKGERILQRHYRALNECAELVARGCKL